MSQCLVIVFKKVYHVSQNVTVFNKRPHVTVSTKCSISVKLFHKANHVNYSVLQSTPDQNIFPYVSMATLPLTDHSILTNNPILGVTIMPDWPPKAIYMSWLIGGRLEEKTPGAILSRLSSSYTSNAIPVQKSPIHCWWQLHHL